MSINKNRAAMKQMILQQTVRAISAILGTSRTGIEFVIVLVDREREHPDTMVTLSMSGAIDYDPKTIDSIVSLGGQISECVRSADPKTFH